MLALAVGKRGGKGVGQVMPTLYSKSKTAKGRNRLFHDPAAVRIDKATHQTVLANVRPDYTDTTDVTSKVLYSLRTLGNLATLHRYNGYDDSTGLGSPRVPNLVKYLLTLK